jgi:D-alanine-D-alanine ligase
MVKQMAKVIFTARGLPVAPWTAFRREDWRAQPSRVAANVAALGFPVFVKPANGGSSVGISKVRDAAALAAAIEEARDCDGKVVVEKGLDVREIEVAVLGNATPEASVPGEIVPSGEFYDYEAKYVSDASKLYIPADLPEATTARVRRLAVDAFLALDLAGMARVDFFCERGNAALWINEVNTLPGFTPISMYPKLWEATGLAYPALLDRLLRLAVERADAGRERKARRSADGG